MSNKLVIKVCFVVAAVLAAGSAYASSALTASTSIGGGTFAPSNSVTLNVAASASNFAGYSGHLNGNRIYFLNNSDPKIYYGTKATGTAMTNTVAATDTNPSFTAL
jgi:hypothetical protein